ncbi:hypothetical protein ETAA8_20690 [Anatilimnocola aggregata]|uniref:Uncharacterized protein n=1 Tax=Anatilimnocola aggregata TaxID=2528021 RepID=A0A517Y9S6_9BACT|nr:hypothetical protein [Anatilimnocola aggregata]QDU26985.1 hypothetical protein ETAA8_20690 [Anatilimnocola aggregata]
MVVLAQEEGGLRRANYLELETSQQPQSIAALLPQVLARYALIDAEVRLPQPKREPTAPRGKSTSQKLLLS